MAERVAGDRSARGEVDLLRHDDGRLELRVNGVFVMDDHETSTERALARGALERASGSDLHVLIGGLGLGFTVNEVVASERVARVDVVELEGAVVDWHRTGVISTAAQTLDDPRTTVVTADIRDHVASTPEQTYDLVLLDVDNGPSYLVHADNEHVYAQEFLAACRQTLRPAGVLVVWSASPEPTLVATLEQVFGACDETTLPVRLGNREETYHLFTAHR